ncbi:MAG: ABC transporter ATP-binding protein [Propionibacteriaceae bacterium]|nr:ABC transporter ATP-binding protein [Propionibacteriaceae bacterium]
MNTVTEPAVVEVRELRKDYGRFQLGPLDLDLPAGYVTGLVGENGAGKTTLLKAMLGLVRPDAGSVRQVGDGQARPGLDLGGVGVVFDHLVVIPEWTVSQAGAAVAPFCPSWDAGLFAELLTRFGVVSGARVGTLSRGEGSKLSLALALARRPRLLILDEPTSGLDPGARYDVIDVFAEFMAADDQHAILFSTHIASDLDRIADHLRVLVDGRLVESGPLPEVLERHAMVRGPSSALPASARAAVRGLRDVGGTFDGLIATQDTAQFGPEVLIEPASIDDIVVRLSHPAERSRA